MRPSFTRLTGTALATLTFAGFVSPAAHAQTQDLIALGYNSGSVSRFAGTGPGQFSTTATPVAAPSLNNPIDLVFDTSGDLFISNTVSNNIVELTAGAAPGTFGPTQTITDPSLSRPEGLAFNAQGSLFVANFTGNSALGTITEFAAGTAPGTFGNGQVVESGIADPDGLAFDSRGDLFAANSSSNSITEFTAGATPGTFGPAVVIASNVPDPRGLVFDARGDLFAANQNNGSITEFMAGAVPGTFGATTLLTDPSLSGANGLAVDARGDLFAANYQGNSITEFVSTSPGTFGSGKVIETGQNGVEALAFTPAAVPEASTTVSFGLLLVLGIIGVRKRKSSAV